MRKEAAAHIAYHTVKLSQRTAEKLIYIFSLSLVLALSPEKKSSIQKRQARTDIYTKIYNLFVVSQNQHVSVAIFTERSVLPQTHMYACWTKKKEENEEK